MRKVVLAALVLACLGALTGARAATSLFPGCEPSTASVTVGRVTCREMPSRLLGGTTAFSYYVPPDCAPALGRRCPVLYLLHGFGGDLTSEIGTGAHPSSTVTALTKGPPVDPNTISDPWTEDPATWVARAPIDFILIAPDGRTVPGGFGPEAGLDGFWSDWNPRYAKGGDSQKYATPPPRFESSIVNELIPYVEAHFPAGAGREWRAMLGTSLGGYGSYKIGLHHPDLFTSIGSISGAHNFLLVPGPDPVSGPDLGVSPPPTPYIKVAGVITRALPLTSIPDAAKQFAVTLYALGDPVGDQAYYRGSMPRDLALNGRASARGQTSLLIRGFSNDAIPRRTEDFSNPSSYFGAQAFELLVRDMNVQMEQAFADEGVPHYYALHPGIHSDVYWDPFLREQLEAQYAVVRHWGGTGRPPALPDVFSYRSIDNDFGIWGWTFDVVRAPIEFLTLTDVSCRRLTLHGTGVVTVTVPAKCHTGVRGSRRFSVDLGAPGPTDDGLDLGATPLHGRTIAVLLAPIRH